jgi:hypothetical protein
MRGAPAWGGARIPVSSCKSTKEQRNHTLSPAPVLGRERARFYAISTFPRPRLHPHRCRHRSEPCDVPRLHPSPLRAKAKNECVPSTLRLNVGASRDSTAIARIETPRPTSSVRTSLFASSSAATQPRCVQNGWLPVATISPPSPLPISTWKSRYVAVRSSTRPVPLSGGHGFRVPPSLDELFPEGRAFANRLDAFRNESTLVAPRQARQLAALSAKNGYCSLD